MASVESGSTTSVSDGPEEDWLCHRCH